MNPPYTGLPMAGRPPPIANPPPQIFGALPIDNSPIGNGYSDAFLPDDYNNYGFDAGDDQGGDDQGDAKRRRIARACDMCRKKKIKCDGKMPRCSHCENYKTECVFTQVEKKRQPPKGAKYIEGLENRLGRMETLLRMSGLLAEDDGRTDLGTLEKRLADRMAASGSARASVSEGGTPGIRPETPAQQGTPQQATVASPQGNEAPRPASAQPGEKRKEKDVEALADQMCSLITNNVGETRYIGSSSGFSIFSPKGIKWVSEKTGDGSFQDMIHNVSSGDTHWNTWKPEIFNDIFNRRTYQPLPPKHEALSLLKDYFENLNTMFPLFHEPTFMHLVHKHYSLEPYQGSGWWASLNVALALAHRIRVMSNVSPQEEDELAWLYLKNAMAVQTELTMRNNDLLSVQALLGMSLFLQGTPNPHPPCFLVSAAIRLAHSIGLHKRGADFHLNEVETEQRKRVFWIAYIMDKDICLRSGRPPVQDDDDMNTDLPSEDPPDNVGNVVAPDGSKFNLLRTMCVFAQIQSKVYKRLYSVKASRQSDGELLNTIGELDQELEQWKDSIPPAFRPEQEINLGHTPLVLHIVVFHFAYYNCLTTIHRMSVHHGYWTSRLSNYAIAGLNARPLNPRVFMSAALCVNAARTSISLLKWIPHGDYACVWLILYYPISALVTLFANILQNPQDARARSDLKLMKSVVDFLTTLSSEDRESLAHFKRMLHICSEFERIGRIALEKAEKEMKGNRKRRAAKEDEAKSIEQQQMEAQASFRPPIPSPRHRDSMGRSPYSNSPSILPQEVPSQQPAMNPQQNFSAHTFNPNTGVPTQPWMDMQGAPNFGTTTQDFSPQDFTGAGQLNMPGADMQNFGNGEFDMGGFQQPFVPQDLWQMPMTLEWDWADIGLGGLGGMPNFGFDNPAMGGGQMNEGQYKPM